MKHGYVSKPRHITSRMSEVARFRSEPEHPTGTKEHNRSFADSIHLLSSEGF